MAIVRVPLGYVVFGQPTLTRSYSTTNGNSQLGESARIPIQKKNNTDINTKTQHYYHIGRTHNTQPHHSTHNNGHLAPRWGAPQSHSQPASQHVFRLHRITKATQGDHAVARQTVPEKRSLNQPSRCVLPLLVHSSFVRVCTASATQWPCCGLRCCVPSRAIVHVRSWCRVLLQDTESTPRRALGHPNC
jgi:hypothetical protein